MKTRWTKEDMTNVLMQLNNNNYPFKKYRFSKDSDGIVLLGSGGYANVYEMESINNPKKKYAVKVIGFGERHVNSEEFIETVQLQQELSYYEKDVVEIIDYVELRISFDSSFQIVNIENAFVYDDDYDEDDFDEDDFDKDNYNKADYDDDGDYINLQFILMEKLIPVLTTDKAGNQKLYPKALADFEEKEIMKLAYNIGNALERAHKKKFLHRDIKLENVFYDPKKKVYKLGDFGIAKRTEDGMASTVAFTKGYGAPEVVGATDERYDNTADIYSFGIMLYLLLNKLKFPDSENYNVNVVLQYSKGYVFPKPEHKDYELCSITGGMCQYDPDERYQSMEDVMNEIEGIMVGENLCYKKEHLKSSYILGTIFYIVGIILWKLTHISDTSLDMGILEYTFLIGCGYKYWLNIKEKESTNISYALLGLGIFILISSGFTLLKLIIILGVFISTENFVGLVSIGGFVIDILSRIMANSPEIYNTMKQYNWIGILFLSLSFFLLWHYTSLSQRDLFTNKFLFKKNFFWIFVSIVYGWILFNGAQYKYMGTTNQMLSNLFDKWDEFVQTYDLFQIGLYGIVFTIGWLIREKILHKKTT